MVEFVLVEAADANEAETKALVDDIEDVIDSDFIEVDRVIDVKEG